MSKDKKQGKEYVSSDHSEKTQESTKNDSFITNTDRSRKGNAGDTENTGPRKKE